MIEIYQCRTACMDFRFAAELLSLKSNTNDNFDWKVVNYANFDWKVVNYANFDWKSS